MEGPADSPDDMNVDSEEAVAASNLQQSGVLSSIKKRVFYDKPGRESVKKIDADTIHRNVQERLKDEQARIRENKKSAILAERRNSGPVNSGSSGPVNPDTQTNVVDDASL